MIHPKIENFIAKAREHQIEKPSAAMLLFLKSRDATQTEAIMVLHQGYQLTLAKAEEFVYEYEDIFPHEDLQDAAYQTFLYMNYNSDDPNFSYNSEMVKFSMKRKKDDDNKGTV